MFQDAGKFVKVCDQCQRSGNLSKRNEMLQNPIQQMRCFLGLGIDFMGTFPNSNGSKYILVAVDYESKWLAA